MGMSPRRRISIKVGGKEFSVIIFRPDQVLHTCYFASFQYNERCAFSIQTMYSATSFRRDSSPFFYCIKSSFPLLARAMGA